MRKLKGKTFVQKIKGKQKYQATKSGIQNMSAVLCVWKQELKPFLTMVNKKSIDYFKKDFSKLSCSENYLRIVTEPALFPDLISVVIM